MATDNVTIADAIWLKGTNDFQQRIPRPTQQGLDATMQALFDPMNRNYYNQFVDALVMRIGMTYVHQQQWKNPLAVFKKASLRYGSTVQEAAVKWVKGHSYNDDAEDVFKLHRPEAAVWYHSQNRRDQYEMSIVQTELRSAFTAENGLNEFVAQCLKQPMNADEYDEYRIMLELIAFYEKNFGFFKHHLSGKPNDEATGKEFLKAVRTYASKLAFPNTIYNGVRLQDLPVFAKRSELVLITTPEINASVDVDTLASVFHLEKADMQVRTIEVDEFPLADDNCVALLTTEDFFQCRDTVYQNDSIYNPKTMGSNYFLNHWGIYSVSPFVPAIMFTTAEGTDVTTVTQNLTGLSIDVADATVAAGGTTQITAKLTGTIEPATEGISLAPDACVFSLSAADAKGNAVQLPSTTRVDEYAVLHLSKSLATGTVVTINAKSTYVNPSGATTALTATKTVTVA